MVEPDYSEIYTQQLKVYTPLYNALETSVRSVKLKYSGWSEDNDKNINYFARFTNYVINYGNAVTLREESPMYLSSFKI